MSPSKALAGQSKIVKFGKKLRRPLNRAVLKYSLVDTTPVLDPASFPWTKDLEANWEVIRAELEAVLAYQSAIPPLGELSPDHKRLTSNDRWRSFFLWGYGYKVDANCRRCPETTRIVSQIPGLKSALFSIHAPGIHIPRHKGATTSMLTCHLGLKVPQQKERCRIKVADQFLTWDEGKTVVFDDTQPHEIWNDTDEPRVILLIQFGRPLRLPGRVLAGAFLGAIRLSPFVREGRRNLAEWERRYRALEHDRQEAA